MHKAAFNRIKKVTKVLANEGMGYLIDQLELRAHLPWVHRVKKTQFSQQKTNPQRVRHILEQLGASYIKLGQLLSVRPDLIPKKYSEEFRKLQDNVNPIPFKDVKKVLEREYKRPVSHIFEKLGKKPIGSASIAQVHRATLKDSHKHVVVKVQRPNMQQKFDADIDVMYFFAHRLDKRYKSNNFSLVQIVKEFEQYTKRELDFLREADQVEKFERAFDDNPHVKIPHCYRSYSTHKVLMLEYIRGTHLSKIDKINAPNATTKAILELGLKQFFSMDIFHADLHPGNIIVMRDGRIALLDFGITGSLLPSVREQAVKMYLSLIDKDLKAAEEALLDLGQVPDNLNTKQFKYDVREVIEEWHKGSTKGQRVTHQMHKLMDVCTKHNVKLPTDMILLAKALVTIEATCLQVDPEFDFVEASKPYLVEVLESELRSEFNIRKLLKKSFTVKQFVERFPRQVLDTLHALERPSLRVGIEDEDIKSIGRRIYLSSDRLSLAMLSGAFVIAGGLVLQVNLAPHVAGYSALAIISFTLAFVLAGYLVKDLSSPQV